MQNNITAADLFYVLNGNKITTDTEKKTPKQDLPAIQQGKFLSLYFSAVHKDLIPLRASIIEE